MDGAIEQCLEAWRTNCRINLFLIDRISEEGMRCTLSKRGGRNVVRQFAHLHNARLWQLASRRARDLTEGLHEFETHEEPDREALKQQLQGSGDAVGTFLEQCASGVGNRRGFKKGAIVMLGYFIAHDSHHRGNILLTLKQCGHNIPQADRYAIWNWDKL